MNLTDVIKGPIVTEKLDLAREEAQQYAFVVDRAANKVEIAQAVESLFKVKVQTVRIMNVEGKKKRVGRIVGQKPSWKKTDFPTSIR